jgi:uncharacterized protein
MKRASTSSALTFAALTLLFSWPLWFATLAGALRLTPLGAFAPGAAALVTAALFDGREGVRELGRRLKRFGPGLGWFALATLLAPALVAVALVLAGPFPAQWSKLALFPLVFLEVLLFTAIGEETGWRGYLLPALLTRFEPLRASVILGLFWALWHLPLFWIPGTAQASIPFGYFAVNLVAYSLLYTFIYLQTGGSLVPALLLHTMTDVALAMAGLLAPASLDSEAFWVDYFWLVLAAAAVPAVLLLRAHTGPRER